MADTQDAEITHKVTEDGTVLVPLTLAHPMPKMYAERARILDADDFAVGDTVWVTREYGNALIDAGMVQVDPIDTKARQAVLFLNRRNQPLTVREIEAKKHTAGVEVGADGEPVGEGDADAAVPAQVEKPQSANDTKSAAKGK